MPNYAHVTCPSCGFQIPGEDMDLSAMAARCRACDALVDLRAGTSAGDARRPASEPLPAPRPARIEVVEQARGVTLSWRWFSWMYVFLAFFCVVWNGFLVFWYTFAVQPGTPIVFALFPVLHVAAGVAITYATIAGFVNRTVVSIDRDHLTVRHGPLPWRGNLDLPAFSIEQLFSTSKVIRTRNGTSLQHNLEAVLKDGRHQRILTGMSERDHALFIEQAIEKHLGIADRPVRSEIPR